MYRPGEDGDQCDCQRKDENSQTEYIQVCEFSS